MSYDEKKQQYAKQLKRMLDDPAGRKLVGETLGLELTAHEELKDKPIVAVLVPSYKSLQQNMMDARTRLLMYSRQFCTIFSEPIRGSSVVSWVRNDMVAHLYKDKKRFTHVLFIDDDMVFEQDALVKMLRHDAGIVGVSYTGRNDPPMPNEHLMNVKTHDARRVLSWEQPGVVVDEAGLATARNPEETITAGTGLMLIRKDVLDRVGQMYIDCEYEKTFYGMSQEAVERISKVRKEICAKTGNQFWFQFHPRYSGYGESGEDTGFCLKAGMCGFKVGVDTTVQPRHIGEYQYSYEDFLPYQESEIEKAKQQGQYF